MIKRIRFEYKLTFIYLIIGGLWILFSDKLANAMTNDRSFLTLISMVKGWVYVLVTGLLFFFFLKKHLNTLRTTEKELEKHKGHLQDLVKQKTDHLDIALNNLKQSNEELSAKSDIINNQNKELKEALHNLKETQAQLLEAEKMASLGVLTAGIAHEINNPLNFIQGGYTGLEEYFKENDRKDENVGILLNSIKTGVERAAAIVSGLTQFGRNDKDYEVKCNIHTIINNCLLMLNSQIQNRIKITRKFEKEPVLVTGNVGKLHQVFTSIILNACQAIEDDGTITITTKESDGWLEIKIDDTGSGIKKEDIPKVTDPFFTTKEPGKGTGLGLFNAYSIIKDHKGKLEFESEVGKGTSVKVWLPVNL